ncbi:MAG: DoxX family protein [Luteitalea sp.]|nr:DoxX family protein [Luteitalea sp.]
MAHGIQKVFGLMGGNQVDLMSRSGVAGVIELIGGALIALGLLTSPVAFLASGEMAFAYFLSHFPRGGWPIQNGGELSALYCFLFLYIAARGSGRLSVDSMRR